MEISEIWITCLEQQLSFPTYNHSLVKSIQADGFTQNNSVVLSPFGLSAALMMLMLGAHGQTKSQLSSAVFHSKPPKDENHFYTDLTRIIPPSRKGLKMKMNNQLFFNNHYNINETLQAKSKEYFNAKVAPKSLSLRPRKSATSINQWIARKTGNRLRGVLSKKMFDNRTVGIVLNTVTYRNNWKPQYLYSEMLTADFLISKNKTVPIEMMRRVQKARYGELKESQVLAIPFQDGRLELVIVLPEKLHTLPNFEKYLTFDVIQGLKSNMTQRMIDFTLPKFVLKSDLDVKTYLTRLGVTDVFNSSTADFPYFIKEHDGRVYVCSTTLKVVAKIQDTKADNRDNSRLSGVQVDRMKPYHKFVANRPFLFYILDRKTGLILFMGRYNGPQ